MKQTVRLNYIDQLKGIAILLVVIGHFLQYNTVESTRNGLFEFIYSFHMPLFIFISGYVAQKTTKPTIFQNYFSFIGKKARGLLIPYFTWALLIDGILFADKFSLSVQEPINLVKDGLGLWFLLYLFLLYIVFSAFLAILAILKRDNAVINVVAFVLLLGVLIVIKKLHVISYIDSFILYYGFFFFGIFTAKYDRLQSLINNKTAFSIFFVIFAVLVSYYDFSSQSSMNKILKLVVAISAIISIYYLVRKIIWIPVIDKYITSFGQNSLIIYATHYKFIVGLTGVFLIQPLGIMAVITISSVAALLAIAFCYGFARVIAFCPPLNLLLYGQKP